METQKNSSISKNLSVVIAGMIFVSTIVVGVFSYLLYRGDTIRLSGDKALAIAHSVAAGVDPAAFERAMAEGKKDESWNDVKRLADGTLERTGIAYLYLIDANYGDNVHYYAEGFGPMSPSPPTMFYETDIASNFADEMFDSIRTGSETKTDIYKSGEFGSMVSGFAPIMNGGRVVGVVGADIAVEDVLALSTDYAVKSVVIILLFSLLFGLIGVVVMRRKIGRPIHALTEAAERIALGDLDVDIDTNGRDEIARLSAAFAAVASSTRDCVKLLESVSEGDLSVHVKPRSDHDMLSFALIRTVNNLNEMFAAFHISSDRLAATSEQIASGAGSLALGAAEQNTSIGVLADSINSVTEKTRESAEMAEKSSRLVDEIKGNAEKGSLQMEQMLAAVTEINEAGNLISRVMKTIDDIAFQTNILALNAAVEAARAGQHGRGFAVVAGEVGNLAQKSAESAKETSELVTNSLEKAALGVKIAHDTSETFDEIVTGINASEKMIGEIAAASVAQSDEIDDINHSLAQVTEVARRTTETASESADAGGKLNEQAEELKNMLRRFRLSDDPVFAGAASGALPPGTAPRALPGK